jgi:DNA-binding IclR family transcriptional regulator
MAEQFETLAADDAAADAPRRIQSLDVGFRLVRVIEEASSALSLKEVSTRADMPRSKAHLYLSTFLGLGLIARDSAGRYTLGPYAIQLGLSALRQSSVVDLADGPMHVLRNQTGHSVHLSVWGNHGPTIVKKLDGGLQVPVSVRVGFVVPLLTSATGRVFLAYADDSLTRPLVEKEKTRAGTGDKAIAELIRAVRAAGHAGSDGGLYEGFTALSAPVFDHENQLCAAVALVDAAAGMPPQKKRHALPLLMQVANDISMLLGRSTGSAARA